MATSEELAVAALDHFGITLGTDFDQFNVGPAPRDEGRDMPIAQFYATLAVVQAIHELRDELRRRA